jgi:hypothetical protein
VVVTYVLLQQHSPAWPAITPALIPPILILYVFALHQPTLRVFFAAPNGTRAVWGVVLLLALAPGPALYSAVTGARAARIGLEQQRVQEGQRLRAANLEKLKTMTPEMPLPYWYPLLDEEGGVRAEALEEVRKVPRRQADIEFLLTNGVLMAMMLLPELDLQARPELCQAANTFMVNAARGSRVRPKQEPREYRPGGDLEASVAGVRWLQAHGCDCDEGLAAMEASVRTFLDTPERKAALTTIAELRGKHQP